MLTPTVRELLTHQPEGQSVQVAGWIRTHRASKNVSFLALNDGSTTGNLQIVLDPTSVSEEILSKLTTGAAIRVSGTLVASQGAGQAAEVNCDSLELLGEADPEKYPLQPKKHSLEFLREIAHLRPRTTTFGAILRVRHRMAYAVHRFFHERGFYWLHTPIITGADAEGAGEMFQVTTLDLDKLPKTPAGQIDYGKDFFGQPANLTVSGQLEGELGAMALGKIYTFGPTFRAENSNTTRHLSEFWMIEPEMAFYELQDNMDLAEAFVKMLIQTALDECPDELEFLAKRQADEDKVKPEAERAQPLLEKLRFVLDNPFERLTYTQAIDLLLRSNPHQKGKFQYPVEWGIDLQSEHERYLVEKEIGKPIFLTDYPREIKAFYMKQNDDGKTVRAMDLLFPGIGEMIGGSQREDNLEKLTTRMGEVGIDPEHLWWFLDTRRFGSAPHSGFGLGFERFLQFVTGMGNIRDVIPFPRYPRSVEF